MDETTPGPWSAPSDDHPPQPVEPAAEAPIVPTLPAPGSTAFGRPAEIPPPPAMAFPDPAAPVSVVVSEPPKKKRTALWVAVALVVVAAGAVGAVFALKGKDGPTYDVKEAAAKAKAATALSSSMTVSAMGLEYDIDAEVDLEAKVMHMTMSFSGAGSLGLPDGSKLDAILDIKGKTMYMAAQFFEDLGAPNIDTDWVKIDEATLSQGSGSGAIFDQLDSSNPAAAGDLLSNAKKVVEIGMDEVDGEKVKHYRITVDMKAALEANPSLQSMIDQSGTDMPDTVDYEVYITKDNELRRMSVEIDLGVAKTKVDQITHILDTPPAIEIPADDNATDINDLL